MSFRDKVGSFLKREAKDLADAAEDMRDKLDDELTKREQELAMTPSERIKALQQKAAATDAKLDGIAGKVDGRSVSGAGATDVPNVTHIVMADGDVTSEARAPKQAPTVVDASGDVVEIPVVQAPTAADLNKVAIAETPPANPPLATRPSPEELAAATHQVVEPTVAKPSNPTAGAAPTATAPPVAPPSNPTPPVTPASPAPTPAPAVVTSSNPAPTGTPQVATSSNPAAAVTPAATTPAVEPNPANAPAAETDYHKAPAQIKYERARAAANDLLDELRGELKDDGEI